MIYTKPLPPVRKLLDLAQHTVFPKTRSEIEEVAQKLNEDEAMIEFLDLFPAGETFKSRADFMTRCEELELLIGQERAAPSETLRSPQD